MKSAPISLLEYFATDLVLATNRSFAPDKPVQFRESEFHVDVSASRISRGSEDRTWQVDLDLKHQPGPETNFAYSYRVRLVGQFGVSPRVKPDEEERMVRIHGASVLYGMAREIARALTGRGPYRPVIIPTVSFYEDKPDSVGPPAEESTGEAAPPRAPRRRRGKAGAIH